MSQIQIRHADSPDQLLDALVAAIMPVAAEAITNRNAFHIVLAGGSSPRVFYQRLCGLKTDWSKWHLYFGDERVLPNGDPGRNDIMVIQAWAGHVPIPPEQIHRIPAELGAEQGALVYRALLSTIASFDLVLLGVGEDGHTASLFPGHEWGVTTDSPDVIAVRNAPKPPVDRISLSASRLSRAENIWVIATGESKRWALEMWITGADVPIGAIQHKQAIELFTDLSL